VKNATKADKKRCIIDKIKEVHLLLWLTLKVAPRTNESQTERRVGYEK